MPTSEKSAAVASYVGPIIRKVRLRAGMTQQALGQALGASEGTAASLVCQYEKGTACPSLPRLFDIAEVLGVEPMDLLDSTWPEE